MLLLFCFSDSFVWDSIRKTSGGQTNSTFSKLHVFYVIIPQNIYFLGRAQKFFWSLSSRGLAGIATLPAQSLRALAQYTFVM